MNQSTGSICLSVEYLASEHACLTLSWVSWNLGSFDYARETDDRRWRRLVHSELQDGLHSIPSGEFSAMITPLARSGPDQNGCFPFSPDYPPLLFHFFLLLDPSLFLSVSVSLSLCAFLPTPPPSLSLPPFPPLQLPSHHHDL